MKKVRLLAAVLLTAMLLILLCGCVRYEEPNGYMHILNGLGVDYTINTGEMWLEYDGVKYPYDVLREGNRVTYTVTYPNGAVYSEIREDDTVQSGWEGEWDIEHPGGNTLVGILDNYYYLREFKPGFLNYWGLLVMIPIGFFVAFFPRTAWELEHMFKSWQYESCEPSDDGIIATRIGGIVCIIVGVIVFFVGWQ